VDLRQFRYFVAVAEELHFTRAAQRLNIGQPQLSLQIQAIEREIATQLLRRNRRGVELTEAGGMLLVEARAVLEHANQAVDVAKRAGRGEIGTLRVRFTPSAPFTRLFTRAVRAYRLALPNLHLDLSLSTSLRIIEGVRAGDVDVGLVRPASSTPMPVGVAAVPVLKERLMLVLHADHRLAGRKRAVPIEALAGEPFLLRPRGPNAAFFEQVFELCAAAGFTPRVVQEATETSTILGLVAAGVGISVLPASFRVIRVSGIVWKELALGAAAVCALQLVFNAKATETPQRARFVDLIKRYAQGSAA
jgi:DNA-binding transcriptional LysR family regulator